MPSETAKPGINPTSAELDEQRRQSVAYEYLCHLEEAKVWMEEMLQDSLPPTTELEESLQHGVYLAKLSLILLPHLPGKVYDADLERYAIRGLQFRHTDNINMWLKALAEMGLPKVFIPTTTDVYERKNMPRVVYCLHALSLLAFKLGKGPQIQDLVGKAVFDDADIDAVSSELRKYGLNMPTFSKIGGILAKEMPVSEATVHAAVIVINEAIDRGVSTELLASLQNPNACLNCVIASNAEVYQTTLHEAKVNKLETAHNRSLSDTFEADAYDEILTQAEIQGHLVLANGVAALCSLQSAVMRQDLSSFSHALLSPDLKLLHVHKSHAEHYLTELRSVVDDNACEVSTELVQRVVDGVNSSAEERLRSDQAVAAVNRCLDGGTFHMRSSELLDHLCRLGLQRTPLVEWAAPLFHSEMSAVREDAGCDLSADGIRGALTLLPALAQINAAVVGGDSAALAAALACRAAFILDAEERSSTRYLTTLQDQLDRLASDGQRQPFLTHQMVQQIVDNVNQASDVEERTVTVVAALNNAIADGDVVALRTVLSDPLLGHGGLSEANLYHCLQVMQSCVEMKQHRDGDADLWMDDIDACVQLTLQHIREAKNVSILLAKLNEAPECIGQSELVSVLLNPSLCIADVQSSLVDKYLAILKCTVSDRSMSHNKSGWISHSLPDGYEVFLHMRNAAISWCRPERFQSGSGLVDQATLQAVVDEVNAAGSRPERWVVPLQAAARGWLLRRRLETRRRHLADNVHSVVRIQAWWRGVTQRRRFMIVLAQKRMAEVERLREEIEQLRLKDCWEREILIRYRPYEPLIVRIQRRWRDCRMRVDLSQLAESRRPSVGLVRKFVHLLDIGGADFREEILLQKLKGNAAQMIRKNQQLEKDLDALDVKIGLLVKNRITLQEVLTQSRSVDSLAKTAEKAATLSNNSGIKSLTKDNRHRLHLYQELFYLLQTEPSYLARLVFVLPPGQSARFLDAVVFSVFSYGANDREEYLLMRLFREALQREVDCRVLKPADVATGSPQVVRLIVQYCRRHSLQPLLAPLVQPVLTDRMLQINTNPVEVYRHWINEQEMRTGQPCGLPYHVTPDEALQHAEVRDRISTAIETLKQASSVFMDKLFSSVDQLPYCLLYMAKVLKQALHDKFSDVAEKDVLKIVGNLVYYRFINSAIIAPDAFDVVPVAANEPLTPDQRKNLGSIAKILQFAASKKGFGPEAGHLRTLNPFIVDAHERFKTFLTECCDVPEPEVHYGRHEFSEATQIAKPIIYITAQEICDLHTHLLEHIDTVAPRAADPLRDVLEELGDKPLPGSIVSSSSTSSTSASADQELCLTLSARPAPADDGRLSVEKTFLQCKQLLLDVLRCTEDPDVASCARVEPTALQERIYRGLLQKRGYNERRRQGNQMLKRQDSVMQLCGSLEETKDALLERLRLLERAGRLTREDDYSGLLTSIVADILHQRRHRQQRRRELVRLRSTLMSLEKKQAFYQEQASFYSQYLRQCLQCMNRSGTAAGADSTASVAKTPGGKSRRRRAARLSLRYSAAKLKEKGVLLGIDGLQPAELKSVQFEISPHAEEDGVFLVTGRLLGVNMEQMTVRLQDLLQLQYDGVTVMNVFGRAKINVNLLIFLLNNKFYCKSSK